MIGAVAAAAAARTGGGGHRDGPPSGWLGPAAAKPQHPIIFTIVVWHRDRDLELPVVLIGAGPRSGLPMAAAQARRRARRRAGGPQPASEVRSQLARARLPTVTDSRPAVPRASELELEPPQWPTRIRKPGRGPAPAGRGQRPCSRAHRHGRSDRHAGHGDRHGGHGAARPGSGSESPWLALSAAAAGT
jgi:hypothetical protein